MKKKIAFLCIAIMCAFLTGCGKYGEKDVLKDLKNNIEKTDGYHLTGVLEIINNEDNYLYDVDVSYEQDDKFRVSLINQTNNHEQIILKNEDGVYVLTPSLNKSFKFQSEWPYNNSQSYLLQNILNDIESDNDRTFTTVDNGYLFTTKVNYLSNKNLTKQNIYLDKELNVTEVHVMNDENQVKIKMIFNNIDMNKTYGDNYFALNQNMKTTSSISTSVSKIDTIVYPMYVPANTYLTEQETVAIESGERAILTFDGDKSFMLVQETIQIPEQYEMETVLGEPYILSDTIAVVNDYSINWQSNGIDYYLMSGDMDKYELMDVASSIGSLPVSSVIK